MICAQPILCRGHVSRCFAARESEYWFHATFRRLLFGEMRDWSLEPCARLKPKSGHGRPERVGAALHVRFTLPSLAQRSSLSICWIHGSEQDLSVASDCRVWLLEGGADKMHDHGSYKSVWSQHEDLATLLEKAIPWLNRVLCRADINVATRVLAEQRGASSCAPSLSNVLSVEKRQGTTFLDINLAEIVEPDGFSYPIGIRWETGWHDDCFYLGSGLGAGCARRDIGGLSATQVRVAKLRLFRALALLGLVVPQKRAVVAELPRSVWITGEDTDGIESGLGESEIEQEEVMSRSKKRKRRMPAMEKTMAELVVASMQSVDELKRVDCRAVLLNGEGKKLSVDAESGEKSNPNVWLGRVRDRIASVKARAYFVIADETLFSANDVPPGCRGLFVYGRHRAGAEKLYCLPYQHRKKETRVVSFYSPRELPVGCVLPKVSGLFDDPPVSDPVAAQPAA